MSCVGCGVSPCVLACRALVLIKEGHRGCSAEGDESEVTWAMCPACFLVPGVGSM